MRTSARRGLPFAMGMVMAASTVTLTACSAPQNIEGIPECSGRPGIPNSALVLMAQAVPSAQLIPCVRSVPVGWTYRELDAHNGRAQFTFDSDREGMAALIVSVLPTCVVEGATKVSSDQPGAEQYERITRVTSGFGGQRIYQFPGGCAVFSFDLHGASRAEPVTEMADALSFVRRSDLAAQVDENSKGSLSLDPTGEG